MKRNCPVCGLALDVRALLCPHCGNTRFPWQTWEEQGALGYLFITLGPILAFDGLTAGAAHDAWPFYVMALVSLGLGVFLLYPRRAR